MVTIFDYYKIKKSQEEVEFVVPFLDTDRKYFIDPALIRFSDKSFASTVEKYIRILNKYIKLENREKLLELVNIGESRDIGLGYCSESTAGSGLGREVSARTVNLIIGSQKFKKRGISRLEELQWLDINIGPDRISDLVGNIIKRELIKFTKVISKKYKIPVREVRVQKIFDFDQEGWVFEKHILPVNELAIVRDVMNPHPPVLFIPTDIAKMLPIFLDYNSYYGFIYPDSKKTGKRKFSKVKVRDVTLQYPELSDHFIEKKEREKEKIYKPDFSQRGPGLYERLEKIPTGRESANEYRTLVREILEFIFPADLLFYKEEVVSFEEESRFDIVFLNEGKNSPFKEFKNKYDATNIIVDAKNTEEVTSKDIAQVSNYLNGKRGRVGFIVSRKRQKKILKHQAAQLKNHAHMIIHITDEDLKRWLKETMRLNAAGEKAQKYSPLHSLRTLYTSIELM